MNLNPFGGDPPPGVDTIEWCKHYWHYHASRCAELRGLSIGDFVLFGTGRDNPAEFLDYRISLDWHPYFGGSGTFDVDRDLLFFLRFLDTNAIDGWYPAVDCRKINSPLELLALQGI